MNQKRPEEVALGKRSGSKGLTMICYPNTAEQNQEKDHQKPLPSCGKSFMMQVLNGSEIRVFNFGTVATRSSGLPVVTGGSLFLPRDLLLREIGMRQRHGRVSRQQVAAAKPRRRLQENNPLIPPF